MNGLEKRLDYIRVLKLNLTGYVNNLIPYGIKVYNIVRRIGGKRSEKPTIVYNLCPTPNNSVNQCPNVRVALERGETGNRYNRKPALTLPPRPASTFLLPRSVTVLYNDD